MILLCAGRRITPVNDVLMRTPTEPKLYTNSVCKQRQDAIAVIVFRKCSLFGLLAIAHRWHNKQINKQTTIEKHCGTCASSRVNRRKLLGMDWGLGTTDERVMCISTSMMEWLAQQHQQQREQHIIKLLYICPDCVAICCAAIRLMHVEAMGWEKIVADIVKIMLSGCNSFNDILSALLWLRDMRLRNQSARCVLCVLVRHGASLYIIWMVIPQMCQQSQTQLNCNHFAQPLNKLWSTSGAFFSLLHSFSIH